MIHKRSLRLLFHCFFVFALMGCTLGPEKPSTDQGVPDSVPLHQYILGTWRSLSTTGANETEATSNQLEVNFEGNGTLKIIMLTADGRLQDGTTSQYSFTGPKTIFVANPKVVDGQKWVLERDDQNLRIVRTLGGATVSGVFKRIGRCPCPDLNEESNPPLELRLTLNKSNYESQEHILASVSLKNIGDQAVLLNSYMVIGLPYMPSPIRGIVFSIVDPSGNSFVPDIRVDSIPPRSEDFIILNPGETVRREYDLWAYLYRFSKVGTYTMIANYQNNIDPGAIDPTDLRVAWKGGIDSNPAIFVME